LNSLISEVYLCLGGPKIKLYKDDNDRLKGDALVTYLKEESVALACQLLDETQLRPDEVSIMRVQKVKYYITLLYILCMLF